MRNERWSSNNRYYILEEASEAHGHVDALLGMSKEMVGWFDRIDDAVDQIAEHLGLDPIPYGVNTDYCIKNDVGYNSAYRVELLRSKIRGQ